MSPGLLLSSMRHLLNHMAYTCARACVISAQPGRLRNLMSSPTWLFSLTVHLLEIWEMTQVPANTCTLQPRGSNVAMSLLPRGKATFPQRGFSTWRYTWKSHVVATWLCMVEITWSPRGDIYSVLFCFIMKYLFWHKKMDLERSGTIFCNPNPNHHINKHLKSKYNHTGFHKYKIFTPSM